MDDWAWKRGQTYGTILVDLERHRPIDLLPDRTSATTEAWLRAHPDIEWVSRDRSGEYAAAARAGAPQAQQVADKFHLLKNLREALQELFERKQSCLPEVGEEVHSDEIPPQAQGRGVGLPVPLAQPEAPPSKQYFYMSAQPRLSPGMTANEIQKHIRRDNRYARYEAARTLYQQGYTIRAIARRLGHARETITHYVQAETFPERAPTPKRGSMLDPYKPYLLQRWQAGCHNGVQLLAEITARGYQGSRPLLSLFLADLRKKHQLVGDPNALRLGVTSLHKKASILDPYKPYVVQRWKEGCWNGMQLYEEIKAQGFPGSQPTLRDFLAELRKQQCLVADPSALRVDQAPLTVVVPSSLPPKREVTRRMSPARASWLLFLPEERLTDRQREQRERLRGCHPDVEAAYQLVSAFVTMLAERRAADLEGWLRQATHSQLPELKRFARGLRRDEAAVRAALSSELSNGQTEGQVLRLKLIKRSMYGRANFDLLRLRVLYRA